ncbi:MAG: 4'-phosphopantetheinyl transferase superfamily protein [Bacteroidaceae bacterium]|nr:4'-phosphopantetheinyl transferase superfamily protein [Bacteroidaceae bacterium]
MIYLRTDLQTVGDAVLQQALADLPDWRREQALRFRHRQGQMECALSYLLLCEGLQKEYGLTVQPRFQIGEHGKPALLEYPHIHFNISHCRAGIAVALSDAPVGIDIECIVRMNESLARHVLNEREYEQVMTAPDSEQEFTKFWTQKEAVAKLTGQGISDNLKQLLSIYNNVDLKTEIHPEHGFVLSIARPRNLSSTTKEMNPV